MTRWGHTARWGALLGIAALSVAGCERPRREANSMALIGLEVTPITADTTAGSELEAVVGAHAVLQAAETWDEGLTARGRIDLGIGGGNGLAGHARLDAQFGLAFVEDGPDHFALRAGLHGVTEGDPVGGLYLIEVPTIFFGYQHHGLTLDDQWHLDAGGRLSFAAAASALAPGTSFDLVAGLGTGAQVILMGPFVTAEATYVHYLAEQGQMHVVRVSACVAIFVAACLDMRHVVAPFGGQTGVTGYYGLSIGFGIATGQSSGFRF